MDEVQNEKSPGRIALRESREWVMPEEVKAEFDAMERDRMYNYADGQLTESRESESRMSGGTRSQIKEEIKSEFEMTLNEPEFRNQNPSNADECLNQIHELIDMEDLPKNVSCSNPNIKVSDFPLDVLYNVPME